MKGRLCLIHGYEAELEVLPGSLAGLKGGPQLPCWMGKNVPAATGHAPLAICPGFTYYGTSSETLR